MIKMKNVKKEYKNKVVAIDNLSVEIEDGEFVYIVGPSGAGKSTFIKLMYREEKATHGEIEVNKVDLLHIKERHVPKFRRELSVVFQDFKLLPKLTAYENVAFALEVIEEKKDVIDKRVKEVLDLVGLKDKATMYPHQLSGGEQQRVSIARSIVNNPKLIIADEPTGNLDPDTSWDIMKLFDDINKRGTTIVMATHNKEIVNQTARRVIAIEGGKIVRDEKEGKYGY